jgi:hypothetical protein
MARALIRPAPLYVNGKKFAEIASGTYELNSNDESQVATDGYMGHADGSMTSKVSASAIVPVKGMQVTVDTFLVNKTYVTVGIFQNGKFHQVDMRVVSNSYKWDFKNGQNQCDISFEGGQPEITG